MPLSVRFAVVLLVAGLATPAAAQLVPSERREPSQPAPSGRSESRWDGVRAIAGFSAGLFLHEAAHLATGAMLGARPRVDRLSIPLPFIVVHYDPVSRRREFAIASAGFWAQDVVSEWLLTAEPHLRRTHAPIRKGLLAFCVATSAMYAVAAMAGRGPERDTRSMAASLGADGAPEPVVGALILAPAALDIYRYYRPDARWARWTSRAVKLLSVGLVFAAGL
jgi:hypothetical protein